MICNKSPGVGVSSFYLFIHHIFIISVFWGQSSEHGSVGSFVSISQKAAVKVSAKLGILSGNLNREGSVSKFTLDLI